MENLTATRSAPDEAMKAEVRDFWNKGSCGTETTTAAKFSKKYFEEIEDFRYYDQPYSHSFAQFTRYRDRKVLEVGFGAGIDFVQWLRAGARLSGIDLTPEALENARHCVEAYGLPQPEEMRVSDAENLPFPDNTFDLGYSFGVLHHTPDTIKAIGEVVRVVKPGGEVKIMIYNRRSIYAVNTWVKHAVAKGKPFKTVAWALWNHMESIGTKAYTRAEVAEIFTRLPLEKITVHTAITAADRLSASALPPLNLLYRILIRLAGERYPWQLSEFLEKHSPPEERQKLAAARRPSPPVVFTGNPLGFYHCITARKKPA